MISVVIAVIGVAVGYGVQRNRVARLEQDNKDQRTEYTEYKKETQGRIDAGFKRLDGLVNRVTILERDIEKALDLETAEKKFITRIEMTLHLEKIEIVTDNTSNELRVLQGKQDTVLDILNMIKDKV